MSYRLSVDVGGTFTDIVIFDDEKKCKNAVLNFPKKIMQMAPGITISQAVTSFEKEEDFGTAVDELE